MKNIIITIVVALLFPSLGWANVNGSKHDMYFMGKGTDQNVCSYCHIPHNAFGEKIWSDWGNEAQIIGGPSTVIGNLCYTCHDGTAAPSSGVFSTSYQSHKIPSGGDCNSCHTVHDNSNGKFMSVAEYQDSYCAACHNNIVNAGGLGDFTGTGNHQSYWDYKPAHDLGGPGQGNGVPTPTGPVNSCGVCHDTQYSERSTDGSCNLCHRIHGTLNYSTPTATNPILKNANTNSWYCVYCHTYAKQTTYGGNKHPSYVNNGTVINCQNCHSVHSPGSTHPHLLVSPNTDSQMCNNCHDGTHGTDIGNSHPTNIPFGNYIPTDGTAVTGTPPANVIDDDGEGGPDYPSNSGNMVCETCHGIHRKADDTGTHLLKITNTSSELCVNCHSALQ